MSTGHSPQDDAELEAFLARESPVSTDYDNLELVEPAAALDATILAAAKAAAAPVARAAATSSAPATLTPLAAKVAPARPPLPVGDDDDDEDGDTVTLPAVRRPRWMLPVALAASVLVAAGIGFAMLDLSPSAEEAKSGLSALFAKRARERSEANKAAAEVAAEELEVMVMEAPPPPPSFEPDRPQVADLVASIALIRRELTVADQLEAPVEALSFNAPPEPTAGSAARSATRQEALADGAIAEAPAAPATPVSVIQPRDRRLAKILELYDAGNPDLAKDALEIFLRDFADDPLSQRILGKP
jgi:hypothetical protein